MCLIYTTICEDLIVGFRLTPGDESGWLSVFISGLQTRRSFGFSVWDRMRSTTKMSCVQWCQTTRLEVTMFRSTVEEPLLPRRRAFNNLDGECTKMAMLSGRERAPKQLRLSTESVLYYRRRTYKNGHAEQSSECSTTYLTLFVLKGI